ncbi:hypothetical protein [Caldimonas brevitalea]|uniref:hypothetical protein n=1 Tax=Caldimonas brevitalea TaxID=413882 RepID=UPI0012FCB8D0|nr:hypothetical protein [Caldimonas brevitalea]
MQVLLAVAVLDVAVGGVMRVSGGCLRENKRRAVVLRPAGDHGRRHRSLERQRDGKHPQQNGPYNTPHDRESMRCCPLAIFPM